MGKVTTVYYTQTRMENKGYIVTENHCFWGGHGSVCIILHAPPILAAVNVLRGFLYWTQNDFCMAVAD